MHKLIDAGKLRKNICEYMQDYKNAPTRLAVCKFVLSMLGDEGQCPPIDPVHAAGGCYCRECVNYDGDEEGWCSYGTRVKEGDFCSRGKPREIEYITNRDVDIALADVAQNRDETIPVIKNFIPQPYDGLNPPPQIERG